MGGAGRPPGGTAGPGRGGAGPASHDRCGARHGEGQGEAPGISGNTEAKGARAPFPFPFPHLGSAAASIAPPQPPASSTAPLASGSPAPSGSRHWPPEKSAHQSPSPLPPFLASNWPTELPNRPPRRSPRGDTLTDSVAPPSLRPIGRRREALARRPPALIGRRARQYGALPNGRGGGAVRRGAALRGAGAPCRCTR